MSGRCDEKEWRVKIRVLFLGAGLFLTTGLFSAVFAEDEIPSKLLEQKNEQTPTTKLVEWRLNSEEETRLIAESFIKNNEDKLGVSFNDLKLRGASISNLMREYDHFSPEGNAWFTQYYHKVPVYGAVISIQINAYGVIWSVQSMLVTNKITAPTSPVITSEGIFEILKKRYKQDELNLGEAPELCIFQNKLAWRFYVLEPVFKGVFVDTQTGDIISESPNIKSGG
jgi:Zn-dependent metalloprotease